MDAPPPLRHLYAESNLYIRVIALSIAFYDYLLTLPAEWRFYRTQRYWRLSPGCMLFIGIRYSSIAVLVTSNVGFFSQSFTAQACKNYYLIPPVLKVVQITISQLILGLRTINISRRAPWVLWTIIIAFVSFSTAEGFLNLWNRVQLPPPSVVQGLRSSCTAGNRPPVLTVWLFYVLAMTYDMLTLGISTYYLFDCSPLFGRMNHLVRIMLTDGLMYFVALTGVNILNLILYRSTDEADQSSGVALGYAVTWIMSQRILIHLRDASAAHNRTPTTQVVMSRQLASPRSVSRAMRSQFDSKGSPGHYHLSTAFGMDGSMGDWSIMSPPRDSEARGHQVRSQADSPIVLKNAMGVLTEDDDQDADLHVSVQVEETVTVEYDPASYEKESYRTPRLRWLREQGQDHEHEPVQMQNRVEGSRKRLGESVRGDGRRGNRLSVSGKTGKSENHIRGESAAGS